jgi:hypothetical protein
MDHAIGRFVAGRLLDHANAGGQILQLMRAVAPALPWLAAEIVDAALQYLPEDSSARARALVAAAEALARTPAFDEGWPRQLAVAAAAFANPGGDESQPDQAARKRIIEDLTNVYSRVPIDVGPDEGLILADVQQAMAGTTKTFWRRHRDEPGTAEAIAIAARQLLTVTFRNHHTTAEDETRIQLRGVALPASRWTREALFTGTRLFAETIQLLPLQMQIEQADKLGNLTRAARGLDGPNGARPSDDMAELAREAQTDLVTRLSALADLPIVVRAALEDELGDVWPDDKNLAEFHDLLSIDAGRWRRDAWNEPAASQRAEAMAHCVLEAEDARAVLDRWATWMVEAQESDTRHSTHILANALSAAASMDPARVARLIDDLLHDPGPLTDQLGWALAVTFDEAEFADERASRLIGSDHEEVRATAVRAVGGSSLAARLDLLTELVNDGSFKVRSAVQGALIHGVELTQTELDLALQACLPNDVDGVAYILWRTTHTNPPVSAVVGTEQVEVIREVVLNAAAEDKLVGHTLQTVFTLTHELDPRLPIDFARARIEQQLVDDRPRDLSAFMRLDPLPHEIRNPVQAAATEDDVSWVLDRIEDSDPASVAHGAIRDLLEWIDDGPIVTERIAVWFASDKESLTYEAERVLGHRLSPDRYRDRARAVLASSASAGLEDRMIRAREPRSWTGTRHRYWRSLRDEFATWIDDKDEALADLGRAGVDYYQRLLDDEPDADPGDDLSEEDEEDA